MVWRRDVSVDARFPREYRSWTTDRAGLRARYVIRDLPPHQDGEALRMMLDHFMRDETTCKSTGAASDPVARDEMAQFWRKHIAERLTLACYRQTAVGDDGRGVGDDGRGVDDGRRDLGELVGLNVCYVSEEGEQKPDVSQLKSASWRQIMSTLLLGEEMFLPHSALGLNTYLAACGLLVTPHCRGEGIATQLVAAREELCRHVGLRGSATVFTASGSQAAAARCGYRLLGEISYKELEARGMSFPDVDTRSVKVMGRRFD